MGSDSRNGSSPPSVMPEEGEVALLILGVVNTEGLYVSFVASHSLELGLVAVVVVDAPPPGIGTFSLGTTPPVVFSRTSSCNAGWGEVGGPGEWTTLFRLDDLVEWIELAREEVEGARRCCNDGERNHDEAGPR